MATSNKQEVTLNDYKSVVVQPYKGFIYYHLKDNVKNKSVTLTKLDLKAIEKYAPKLKRIGHELMKKHTKEEKKKKSKKFKDEELSLSESDNSVEMSD